MRWIYLLMLRRANNRLVNILDSLPPGWESTPEEFILEFLNMDTAYADVQYWNKKLDKKA
jgi:hypothetical protein